MVIGPKFELETREDEPRPVVVVRGEIDVKTAPALESMLDGHREGDVVVDLSAVEFIDSTGLRALTKARSRLDESGAVLYVLAPEGGAVRRTMRLAGLATDFAIVGSAGDLPAPS